MRKDERFSPTSLTRSLGLEVVAEDVETAGQLQRLKELGCEFAQGYCSSKPLPADILIPLLTGR